MRQLVEKKDRAGIQQQFGKAETRVRHSRAHDQGNRNKQSGHARYSNN
jgi:hypothetical protein